MLFAVHRVISLIWRPGEPQPGGEIRMNTRIASLRDCGCADVGHGDRAPGPFAQRVFSAASAARVPCPRRSMVGPEPTAFSTSRPSTSSGRASFWCATTKTRASRNHGINLYIAYFPTQKAGDTIHSPNHCLPGAGWVPTSRESGAAHASRRLFVPRQPLRGFKIGRPATGVVLVSGAWPRGGQRVLGQVLSGVRFDSHESQRRGPGAPDDPDACRTSLPTPPRRA